MNHDPEIKKEEKKTNKQTRSNLKHIGLSKIPAPAQGPGNDIINWGLKLETMQ